MVLLQARVQDLDEIMNIIHQAQAQLAALGVDQWQDGYPDRSIVLGDIERQEGYLLLDEQPLAYAAVSFSGEKNYDVIYQGDWQAQLPYAVIHRVATGEASRRRGAAGALMHEAFSLCAARNVQYVRIDTHQDNLPMQGLLEKLGFSKRGIIHLSDDSPRLAYDKLLP